MPLLVAQDIREEVHTIGWLWSRLSGGKQELATTGGVCEEYLGCAFLCFLLSFTEQHEIEFRMFFWEVAFQRLYLN